MIYHDKPCFNQVNHEVFMSKPVERPWFPPGFQPPWQEFHDLLRPAGARERMLLRDTPGNGVRLIPGGLSHGGTAAAATDDGYE